MSALGIYFTSTLHAVIDKYHDLFGLMFSMADTSNGRGAFRMSWLESNRPWMLDNGMFVNKFEPDKWLMQLEWLIPHQASCLAIVVPDAVADKRMTLIRWQEYAPIVHSLGYPLAFVSQDGLQVDEVPWGELDMLFIGGTDFHKLDKAWPLIREAQKRGKWIHVGRVNSALRLLTFWMANSWDGTTLGHEPSIRNQIGIVNAIRISRSMKLTRRLL